MGSKFARMKLEGIDGGLGRIFNVFEELLII